MKKAFWIPATLFFMVLARHALAFYVDGSGTVPDALSGFVVPSGETSRGNVLAFSGGETWTLPVDASAHPVVSFVAKGSGVLAIEGASSVVIDSSEWRRHVIAVDGLSSLSFSATGEFKLDDFYLGRQLTNSLLNADDVLSCQGQEDGVLSAMADGGSIGMWESVKDFYGNDWTSDANGLKARISTSYAGLTNVCHMVAPLAAPLSDNIVVSFEVQKQRRLYNRPDRLFVAVSTNDCIAFSEWQSAAIALCEPFLVSFDDETDYSAGDWVPCSYGLEIKGLQGIPSVEIGFLTVAGRSGENVCIRNVSVTYMTRVTATAAGIEAGDGTGIIENPRYGLDGHARVNVNSTSDATGIDISVTHTRTHFGTRTYTFGPSSGPVPFWISPDEFDRDWGHVLEAGETNEFTVVTSYRSSQGLDTSHSPETDVFSFVVGGLGSVWINEIDAGNGKLELAGPPDRQITGWSLRKKGDENPLLTELSGTFGGAERGMAFLVLEHLAALSTLSAPVELELVNAAGIVEATTCEIDFSTKKIWAATGRLPYIADGTKGDWTGVSAGFSAMVNEDEASATFGHMNENVEQGADLPVRLAVEFRSLNQNNLLVQSFNPGFTGNPDLSLSFSILDENPLQERIAVITNELGDVVGEVTNTWLLAESVPDEPEGMATATTNVWYRYTAFLENLIPGTNTSSAIPMSRVTTLATAFGFYGETEIEGGALRLDDLDDTKVTTNVVRFLMRPSVGTETFGTDFRNRWNLSKDDGSVGEWVYQNSGGADGASDGFARAGISTSWSGSAARMQTGGTMSRRLGNGVRSYLKFSTTVKNTMAPSDSRKDVLSAILRDAISRDAVVSLTNANNRQPLYPQNTWVRFDQFARIPDEAPESFVFEIAAVAGRSGVNLDFDDLYVSFQDWAGVTDCVLTPAVPQAGKALKAEYTLASGDGGASNVVVSLVASLTRNGTTTVSTNEVFDIDWLEGSTSLAVENVLMKSGLADTFLEQDVFRFYFQTDYDTDNGAQQPEYQRDQSYYPGNATGSIEDGTWVAVGGNGPAAFDNQLGGTAWGVQEVWVNEINQTFVELCGMTNADITAWSLSVYSDAGAYQSSLSVTNKWEWSNTEENPGYGFYCFSNLNLLRAGALVVKDAEQRVRYAVSYGCSLPGYEQLGTDTVTVSGNTSLAATEYGNPANKAFENWESQSSSQDARNEDEDLVNKGPVSPLFTATAQSATNIVLFATASDMDKPLSYSIDGGCTWQTNELDVVGCTWNVGELDFNTRYEWTLRTKDAAGKESEETATVARYTLLDSFTATAEGAATDTITITATVPGLGNGQTAWWVDDTSVTNTEVSQIYSGEDWGPNSPHSFTLNACNGDGTTCATPVPVSGYTLAAVPGAALSVSNEANVVRLRLVEDADYANGNPDSTEYAVKATLYYKGQSASQSRYWTAGGDKPAWHTLADWPDVFAAKGWADDITPTNIVFQLVARNGNGTIKEEAGGPAAETHFELSIEPAGDAEQQYGNGLVELSALITNPWTNETAVALWYVVGNATNAATIAQASAAYGAAGLSAVETWKSGTNTVTVLWNAGQDLGAADVENVSFVWTAVTENSAPVDSTQAQGCDVYLARPAVTSVTAPASPAKKAESLPFTVVFDDPVSNLTAEAFSVTNGRVSDITPVNADNGLATTFTVAIAPSDQAADSLEVAITGIATNAAADDWGNLSQAWTGNAAVTYDGKAPTVAITSDRNNPFNTSPMTVTFTFSEAVVGFTKDDVTVTYGTKGAFSGSGKTYTLVVTPSANKTVSISVAAGTCTDQAGNANTASSTYTRTYDTTAPTVSITSDRNDPFNTSSMTATLTFSEAVIGLTKDDVTVVNGTKGAFSGSGKTYTLVVTPSANKTVSISVAAGTCMDQAGNANTASATYTRRHDSAKPTLISMATPDVDADIFNTSPLRVVLAFSEPVANLTTAVCTYQNVASSSIASSADRKTWTLSLVPSKQAEVRATISGAADLFRDDAGNGNAAFPSQSIAKTYDTGHPEATLSSTTAEYFNTSTFPVTIQFSKNVKDFAASDITVVNGTVTALTGSDAAYTATVKPTAQGAVAVSLAANVCTDRAGNPNDATVEPLTRVYDSEKPEVTLSNKPADPTGEGDFAIAIEATDANADKGFAFAWRVQCGGACVAEGSAPAGTAGPYTARGSGLAAGTYTFTATATDAAGNESEAATATWTVDGTKPTCTITRSAALVKGNNATFTIVFSEAVTGFVVGDIVADNCTLSNFSGSGTTYTVKATATSGATTIGISVPAHVCEDAQGNGNEAGALVTCTVDNTAPAIANLSATPARAKTGASVTVFFDVTEANGIQSVTVGSQAATKGAEAGINTRYSKTVAAGTAALSVTATDKAGNSTTKSFSNWVVIDNTAPVVTWTGLPTGETNATAVTAELTGVTDDDPNVRLAWSLDGGAEAEDWAVVGKKILFNELEEGVHTFAGRIWDTAGNTNTWSYTWTNVDDSSDTSVTVTGEKDGDSAVFTVTWDDETQVFSADSFALRVNNAETGTTVVTPVDANTATVTVPLTSYTEGAYVELTVPAGSLGNRMESNTAKVAGFTPAAEPTLTYVGRSLTEPDILTWELRNASGAKAPANFSVFDPNPGAGNVSTDLSSIAGVSTKNGVTTIRVRDGGRAAVSSTVMNATESMVTNWMADAFVNYRLVYDNGAGTILTNVGPAEVNLALPEYGGSMVLNGATNVWNLSNTAWNTGKFADGVMQSKFKGGLGSQSEQPYPDDIGYMTSANGGLGYRSLYGRKKEITGNDRDDTWLWESAEPVVIRSVQWMCAPVDAEVAEVFGITNATLDVKSRNGVTLFTTNMTWTLAQAKTKGFLYRIDIPEHVATNAARVLLSNIKSTKQTSVGGQNVYHIMLSEFAMMGAPASIACERPVPEITLTEAVKSEPGDLLFHVEYPQGGCGIDLSKASASGVAGTAAFTAENVTDTGCDLRVGGLTGAGDLTLTLAEDFERTPDGKSSVEAVWTGAVDCELPTLAFDAPVAANGLCTFTFATSELATGIGTNGMTLVTTGGVQAELASLERDGVNYTVVVRASGWQAGDKLKLRVAVTLTDLAGNTNAVDVTSNAVRLTDPTTDAVPSVTVTAGAGGTVSPAGTVAATNGTLKVTATPNAGYTFTKWTVGGMQKSTSVTASLTGLADGAQVQAVFTKEGTVNLKAAVNNSNYGTASWTSKSVSKGSNQSVTFTAKPGYYVSQVKEGSTVKVTTSNYPTSYTYSIDNVTANKTITGVFEALPTYTVSIHEKWKNAEGAVTNTVDSSASVNYNADWSRTFTATAGYAIESVSAGNASKPAAAGASAYTVQLRGVIAATTVEVVYMPVLEEEEPEEFTLTDLSWTSLDMEEGTLAFAATLEGEAPDALTLVYRTALGSSAQKAPGCGVEWSAGGGVLTLPDGWDDDVGFFAIGLEW